MGGRGQDMAQQLGALVLSEDLGLVPSTHVVAHNQEKLHFQGTQCPLLASVSTHGARVISLSS